MKLLEAGLEVERTIEILIKFICMGSRCVNRAPKRTIGSQQLYRGTEVNRYEVLEKYLYQRASNGDTAVGNQARQMLVRTSRFQFDLWVLGCLVPGNLRSATVFLCASGYGSDPRNRSGFVRSKRRRRHRDYRRRRHQREAHHTDRNRRKLQLQFRKTGYLHTHGRERRIQDNYSGTYPSNDSGPAGD